MSQISQPLIDHRCYPLLFVGAEEIDPVSALTRIWGTYKALSQEKKDILMSDELPEKIKAVQDTFQLSDEAIGNVTVLIRKIFFGELSLEACEAKVGAMLVTTGGGDPNQAKAIIEFIQKEILTIQPKPRVEEVIEEKKVQVMTTVNMPILQALSKYEGLGNQLITKERIRMKSQGEPVRPSLLYWLKYYRDELGIGQHNSVERGQFLFRSENGKSLSAPEREHVNLILKSIEENFPLVIDTEHQEIVFPAFQGVLVDDHKEPGSMSSIAIAGTHAFQKDQQTFFHQPSVQSESRVGQVFGAGGMSFSSSHTFPAEKEVARKSTETKEESLPQSVVPSPSVASSITQLQSEKKPQSTPPQFNPFSIHPVSRNRRGD